MRRMILGLIPAFALAVMPLAAHSDHHEHHSSDDGRDFSISIDADDDGVVSDCSQIKVTYAGEPAVRAEEMLPAAGLSRLRVNARNRSGVRVNGWSESGWSIKACKAAASATALNDIHVSLTGDELSANSMGDESFVYFIIRAPRNATLDVDSTNGPIGLYDVNGTMKLHAQNGPVSLKRSTGTIDASTVNGPIAFAGDRGTVKLTAQNGPISLKLDGSSWDGSLDASTQNGPLSIKLPRNYRSGVIAESRGHGPVSCRADACSGAKRTWDDDDESRRIELGSGPAVIHVSTNNGPLSIKER